MRRNLVDPELNKSWEADLNQMRRNVLGIHPPGRGSQARGSRGRGQRNEGMKAQELACVDGSVIAERGAFSCKQLVGSSDLH